MRATGLFCVHDDALGHARTDPAERVGTVVGQRYKIVSVLGEGGMGMVFLAEDLKARRARGAEGAEA